jgi:LuxR family transcriptional regulator, quorum-sensing system regulator BjaR1
MSVAADLIALAERLRGMNAGAEVLDTVQQQFRDLGADHFLATGLPLPGRPLEPLVLRLQWGEVRADRGGPVSLTPDDPLIQIAFRTRRPTTWIDSPEARLPEDSPLRSELGAAGARVVAFPICSFLPYQAIVMVAGQRVEADPKVLVAGDYLCGEAFRRLFALGYLRPERPGELSARERKVVELSATGKTANQIATILEISQRTVHAHLQNASEKLRAHNKTHTVVEALRYGQITV